MRKLAAAISAVLAASPALAQAPASDFVAVPAIEGIETVAAVALSIAVEPTPGIEQIGAGLAASSSPNAPRSAGGGDGAPADLQLPGFFLMTAVPSPNRILIGRTAGNGYAVSEAYVNQIGAAQTAALKRSLDLDPAADTGGADGATSGAGVGETVSQSVRECVNLPGSALKDDNCPLGLETASAGGLDADLADGWQPGSIVLEANGATLLNTAPAGQATDLPPMLSMVTNISSTFQTKGNYASIRQK